MLRADNVLVRQERAAGSGSAWPRAKQRHPASQTRPGQARPLLQTHQAFRQDLTLEESGPPFGPHDSQEVRDSLKKRLREFSFRWGRTFRHVQCEVVFRQRTDYFDPDKP
jgi:hypothetical protein